MKKLILLAGIFCFAYSARAENKTAKIKVKASIYCDHCQQCESCGKRLENAIYKVKGVKRMDLDVRSETVDIVYNAAKTTPEQIRTAITEAGFDADGLKGNAKAYEQWDNCCKRQ
ncbi:heavy-metal-associated domain-containing protein [Taibaiella koreensis]|uniref:heavy-metal-associated domain-containing protein n=1 Tax=Taibaiella koreensis TaxID=1268548 RepID=UPI000E59ABA5|nr:heavy-metal-associated domain-containing protein [Taibaiella koreensis]